MVRIVLFSEIIVFSHATPCSLVDRHQRFGVTWRLRIQKSDLSSHVLYLGCTFAPVAQFRGTCYNERLGCFCPHAASTLTLAGGSVMPCYCATHLDDGDHALVRATRYQSHPTRWNIPFFYDTTYVVYSTYSCGFKVKEVRESVFVYYSYIL